jgi:hypothetical protein
LISTSHAQDEVPSQARYVAGFTQTRPAQQAPPPTLQVWPVLKQPPVPASGTTQVPLVLPAGRLQVKPVQQSPELPHAPPLGWQLTCGEQ